MGKTLVVALLGISVIGGFVVLEAQQRALSPEEQIARYKANERARSIAHLGYMRSREFVRERLTRRRESFQEIVTGRSSGGVYRCSIAVDTEDRAIASIDIVSYYRGATHQITATLTARGDMQLDASDYEELYTARHIPEDW